MTPADSTASPTTASNTLYAAAAMTANWSPSPFAPVVKVVVELLLSLGGMNPTQPKPATPVQQLLYSLARRLNDTFDPAPSAGTPTVGTPDLITGNVTGSLGFPKASGLTYTVTQPSVGTVSVASDGSFIYTPTATARQVATATTGAMTVTFTATVHEGLSSNTVTVTVPVDPYTRAVETMTRPNGQIWGFLLDAAPDSGPITYTVDAAPQFGTVSISQYGVYTYTPGQAFTGTDTFTATIHDPASPQGSIVSVTVVADPALPTGTVIDNFNGPAGSQPNPALWTSAVGGDAGLETYTDSSNNVRLDGQGHLVIQALETQNGYTSGRVITQGNLDMLYGTMTARIEFPSGQGIWPSFWELGSTYNQATDDAPGPTGWPGAGEIDVMELVNNGKTYYVTLHGPQGNTDYYGGVNGTGQVVGTSGPIADLTTGYHDYWVMREPNIIVVGVDDTMLATFTPASLPAGGTWVFNNPFFAVLDVAVGGSWAGPPDSTTPWPATMLVDSFTYEPYA
ncbi:Ig-like domain-containing protein [Mycobacterium sp. OTB74]|uniref:Ig-like domain-containing protein n=1 Tax=Mycobacterium sp. OTB74 TaxID=1853452 RepID=UPI002473381E|nr:Ig-like domain-containing protein [Mycobacterium sp. OTB74]